MKVFGELEAAQAERLSADPSGVGLVEGRIWFNTTDNSFKGYDGTNIIDLDNRGLELTEYTQQGATPATPAAGNHKIFFKTDGTAYTLDENGNEAPLGSGGGGSKNYITDLDSNIDSTIANWLTDDGVGGASAGLTLAVTAVAGELLAGTNSLKLSKDAADRNGHFIKVLTKTIDPADRGDPLYGSFQYKPITGYVSGDLVLEIYDVTNAAVLYAGTELDLLNAAGRFDFVAYLEDTTAQIEFRLKVNNTNTNAFEVTLDEFKLGPAAMGGLVTSNELALQTIFVSGQDNGNEAQTAGVTGITFNEVRDSHNAWDGNTFTAPRGMYYAAKGFVSIASSVDFTIDTYINGALERSGGDVDVAMTKQTFSWQGHLEKGDELEFRLNATVSLASTTRFHWIEINSIPDLSLYGAVRNDEYIESVISSAPSTTAANTYIDTNGEVILSPGTWDIGYNSSLFFTWVSGTAFIYGSTAVRDSANNVVGGTVNTGGATMQSGDNPLFLPVTGDTRITITEETTYKLSYRCSSASALAQVTLGRDSFTGGLTNPDARTVLWARRVK